MYTTQLSAGLGLIEETRILLDLWKPGMNATRLHQVALASGHFPNVSARRLRNIVVECFAPRYMVNEATPAQCLQKLAPHLLTTEWQQLFLLYTSRANKILADFVRQVYWERYVAGYSDITNQDARAFVMRAIDDENSAKRWSESTQRHVASYLTGCCADYGLLDSGQKITRRIIPVQVASKVAAYLAYDLHFAGIGDNTLLCHEDWALFGLDRADVLEEVKRLSLQGLLIVQSAGEVIRISWKYPDREALCDVLAQS